MFSWKDLHEEIVGSIQRRLEDEENEEIPPNDSEVLRNTFRVYGGLFAVVFAIFIHVRMKYPRAYNVRSWVKSIHCQFSENHYGYFSWILPVWNITDDELREQCGMDAVCFIRILKFGLKIALVGMFNSLWLMPVYATAQNSSETDIITDHYAMVTLSHVPPGSPRLLATVLGIYIMFGYIFYQLLCDFQWFTEQRHLYLMSKNPKNYSIYVSHIPPEHQSSLKLQTFFRRSFPPESVLEARCALKIPHLESAVAKRDGLVKKLEHAINVQTVQGKTPTHLDLHTRRQVNSIEVWTQELSAANDIVAQRIADLEKLAEAEQQKEGGVEATKNGDAKEASVASDGVLKANTDPGTTLEAKKEQEEQDKGQMKEDSEGLLTSLRNAGAKAAGGIKSIEHRVADAAQDRFDTLKHAGANAVGGLAHSVSDLITGTEDGAPFESGFVTFTKISSAQLALQMRHHRKPFAMHVQEAPEPAEIIWQNVGKSHYRLQIGKLFSIGLTVTLCVFWTIPVAFIASLAEVEALKQSLPFLETWIEDAPWLGDFLAQLAPLLIVALNSVLPYILVFISSFEGPISRSQLEGSAFIKLASFMIIQTFFISALSGSLLASLSAFLDSPELIVDILATSLTGQSTYFVQILLVQTFLALGLEILRVAPVCLAGLRRCMGHNLTEKERNTAMFGFLRPLADVSSFEYFRGVASALLNFMVQFVYSSSAPVNWFFAFAFAIKILLYKYQFVYIYPIEADTGGKIWLSFTRICLACILLAQLALIGILLLKKSALATPFMLPLIIFTILFTLYVQQEHYKAAEFLPSIECYEWESNNNESDSLIDHKFLEKHYLQPAMKSKEAVLPDNMTTDLRMRHEDTEYSAVKSGAAEPDDLTGVDHHAYSMSA